MRAYASVGILICGLLDAQAVQVQKRAKSEGAIRGAASTRDGGVFTWGDQLVRWKLPSLEPQVLAKGHFSEGGCLVDLDSDGQAEFVAKEGSGLGRLTWRKPPYTEPVVIDQQVDTHDCLEATLFGRKGLLTIHRHMQVRFYERNATGAWPYREIYSIYTPSQQSGLSLRDVDGDGFIDIICGNYWIQSPARFDLPWHIFAINTYFEQPLSAMLAHAFFEDALFVAQSHVSPARVALFRKPADPKQLWIEQRLGGDLDLHRVHGVAVWKGTLFFGENNGPASRTFALRNGSLEKVMEGVDVLKLLPTKSGMLSAGPGELVLWR